MDVKDLREIPAEYDEVKKRVLVHPDKPPIWVIERVLVRPAYIIHKDDLSKGHDLRHNSAISRKSTPTQNWPLPPKDISTNLIPSKILNIVCDDPDEVEERLGDLDQNTAKMRGKHSEPYAKCYYYWHFFWLIFAQAKERITSLIPGNQILPAIASRISKNNDEDRE